jgi:hypothetical protein
MMWSASRRAYRLRLRDMFTTAATAPLGSPLVCDPGPGSWTLVDTGNRCSKSSGALQIASGAGSYGNPRLYAGSYPRRAGRALVWSRSASAATGDQEAIGWDTATTGAAKPRTGFWHYQEIESDPLVAAVYCDANEVTLVAGTTYHYAVVLRSTGAYYLVSGGAFATRPNWKLYWVDRTVSDATVYAMLTHKNAATVTDAIRVVDFGGAWRTDYGLAVSRVAAPVTGETITTPVEHLTEFTWTPVASEVLNIRFRRTDDNNCWIYRLTQATGAVELISKTGGVETVEHSGTATMTAGVAVRLVVNVRSGRLALQHDFMTGAAIEAKAYKSSGVSFNSSVTGLKITGFATGSNLVCWPRDVYVPLTI